MSARALALPLLLGMGALTCATTAAADAAISTLSTSQVGGSFQVTTANGAYLYQITTEQPNISAYAVDATTGALTLINNYTYTIPGMSIPPQFLALAIDNSRNLLFAAEASFTNTASYLINVYRIGSDGTLTEVSGSPFPVSQGMNNSASITSPLAVDSVNGRLFVMVQGAVQYTAQYSCGYNSIVTYSFDDKGTLTPVAGPTPVVANSPGFVLSPDGRYVIAVGNNMVNCGLAGYPVSNQPLVVTYPVSATGALGASAGSQAYPLNIQNFSPEAQVVQTPIGLQMHPSNGNVYLLNYGLNPSVFTLNSTTGALTVPSAVTSPNANGLVFSAHGHRAWAIANSQIQSYQVNATGSLQALGSPLSSAPATDADGSPSNLVISADSTRVMATVDNPASTWVYATNLPVYGATTVTPGVSAVSASTPVGNAQPGCTVAYSLSTTAPASTTTAPANAFSVPAVLQGGVMSASVPLSRLTVGATYYVRAAVTCSGSTLYSPPVSYVHTQAPAAPVIGTASVLPVQTGALSASAQVVFTPGANGGTPITGYTVTSTPGGLSAGCNASPCTLSGLTFATRYTFSVTAQNAVGSSVASAASNSVTPLAAPSAPQNVSASFALSGSSATINVSFAAPATNGGSPITGYTMYLHDPNTQVTKPYSCNMARLSCSFSNATLGGRYYVYVVAVNSIGTGATSTTQTVIPVAPPSAPQVGSAVAGPVAGLATVRFTPAFNGGSAVTAYTVSSVPSGGTGSCSASPCTVSGLTTGNTYSFTVTATNAAGTSSASAASNMVVAGVAPAPRNVVAATTASGVSISFGAPMLLRSAGPSASDPLYSYLITNNVDTTVITCTASPCTVLPSSSGQITFSVATFDKVKQQVSQAVSSNTPIKAAVFAALANTSWSIPAGVQTLNVIVTGGGGGGGGNANSSSGGGQAGAGAMATATLTVGSNTSVDVIAGAGGAGGQNPISGGGGGGASALRMGSLLLVAGGGGGGGAQANPVYTGPGGGGAGLGNERAGNGASGGVGGAQGSGGVGTGCPLLSSNSIPGSGNGGAGGQGAGGAAGGSGIWSTLGGNGGNANDSRCGSSSGGGGGGGGYGGGGGGGGWTPNPPKNNSWGYHIGGGGGGGSTGPDGVQWQPANNGGAGGANGGNGSVVIFFN
ncbi:MAG: fibronectin type III domain-containing protein [Pedobacter sp.]|nr:fibronectin type III domain-containing protein [Pedobacter sp.]